MLGLTSSADAAQIKAAYKRLAMQYHPDRNAGDKSAEEMFKLVNEAYHVLSDPLKKSRFDQHHNPHSTAAEVDQREMNRRRYYQWKHAQQNPYRFDQNYFKIQGLAVLTFFIMAGICYGIIHTATYFIEQKRIEKFIANSQKLKVVNGLFESERFSEAFGAIDSMRKQEPLEFRFIFARDSLVSALRKKAEQEYRQAEYARAVKHFVILQHQENPTRLETLNMIANCQFYLGNYPESLQAYKHIHHQQPHNLDLIYQIASINLEKLQNSEEALQYFTLGKVVFKKNMSDIYGEAFELIMDPADVPDIYFKLFIGRAKSNILQHDFTEAITDGNWAIYLRRNLVDGYEQRAFAKAYAQDYSSLCEDVVKAKQLGSTHIDSLQRKHCR
ncbi:MAG: DnaJ domain-containing protein [Cyclobacteriaceae bacterium]|nr:DnaJ domain-containing protein [Cyclobacteriaceae bacterium]